MAINLNRVDVIGNLTRDPELRYTPNGQAVASFAVATNRRYRDQAGNWVDADPEFHEIVVWAKLAEGVNQTLKKGDRIYVTGRQQTRSWEGQDGNRRNRTELVADTIVGPDQVNRASYGGGAVVQAATVNATPATTTATPAATQAEAPASAEKASPQSTSSDDEEINIEDIPF